MSKEYNDATIITMDDSALCPLDVKQQTSANGLMEVTKSRKPKLRKLRRIRRLRHKIKVREEINRVVAKYVEEHRSPSMTATQEYANKVMAKIDPLRQIKSRDNKIEKYSVESNDSSIELPLRSYDDAVNQRKQVPSVHLPSDDLGKEGGRPLVLQIGRAHV